MRYLLDTNVISELVARAPDPKVIGWIDSLDPELVYLSVITIGEIRKGISKLPDSRRKEQLSQWLEQELLLRFSDKLVSITVDVMLGWGDLTGRLEREGRPVKAIDSLIAASALAGGYTIATRNVRDFQEMQVQIINPWEYSGPSA